MAKKNKATRYSDKELEEFKAVIDAKLVTTREQLESLQAQLLEVSVNTEDEHGGDWVDDSSINSEVEMLGEMANRQAKYLRDLENALLRIRNKVYGICVLTGELIDKRRLKAVPTTTKSLIAKDTQRRQIEKRMTHRLSDNPYVKKSQQK